jgi:hypothetical protein
MKVEKVDFYSGGKKDELPKTIYTNSGKIKIYKIIETKLEEDYKTGNRKKVFIFKSIGGYIYQLEFDNEGFKIRELK